MHHHGCSSVPVCTNPRVYTQIPSYPATWLNTVSLFPCCLPINAIHLPIPGFFSPSSPDPFRMIGLNTTLLSTNQNLPLLSARPCRRVTPPPCPLAVLYLVLLVRSSSDLISPGNWSCLSAPGLPVTHTRSSCHSADTPRLAQSELLVTLSNTLSCRWRVAAGGTVDLHLPILPDCGQRHDWQRALRAPFHRHAELTIISYTMQPGRCSL